MTEGSPIKNVLTLLSGVAPSGDSGKQWVACCPSHPDQHQSLGVAEGRDGRVLINCYAGCDRKDILHALGLEFRDLFPGRVEKPEPAGVSVGALAWDKRLPLEFLRTECKLTDEIGKGKGGGRQVLIPYYDAAGNHLYTRFRTALKASEGSSYKRGTEPRAYGLWRLPQYRTPPDGSAPARVLILVEGESDAWTLWYHNYPALGIPGADAVNALHAEDIAEFDTIYIWRDSDGAGAKFVTRMAARIAGLVLAGGRAPAILVLSSGEAKDPNRILQLFGEGAPFRSRFEACLAAAASPAKDSSEAADPVAADFPLTDMGNAQRLVAQHGQDIRFADSIGKWHVWSGNVWKCGSDGPIFHRAKLTVRGITRELDGVTDTDRRTKILAHAIRSESYRAVSSAVKLAESDPTITISPSDLDADRFLLNVRNGTIDLRTGELLPHRREDLITRMAPVDYDPDAPCPTWKVFLARVFAVNADDPDDRGNADTIQFLKRLLGYCITGDISEQVFPIFWGGGSNGKSTLLNVVREILGYGYATKAPRGMLMAKKQESHPTELTVLFGARLAIATESKRGQRLSEDLVKDLTGDEAIKARHMREDFFEFEPTHKLVLMTNHKPRIPESDDGIWRRVLLVPFKSKFWNPDKGETGPEHLRRDNALKHRLREEFPGILAWIVRGCLEWQKTGLGTPAAVEEETASYRTEEDRIAQYLAERCSVSNSNGHTLLADVYADFVKWCESESCHPFSKRDFTADLRSKNVVVKNGHANKVYCMNFMLNTRPYGNTVSDLSDIDD